MTATLRKGWCPGALRPMPAKDGLLVRLRITGGILTVDRAHALADLAERCGDGLFDLTGRANLQMRGVRGGMLGTLQDGLSTLGLLDGDAGAEAVRNVIGSPLAALHDNLDIRPLTEALEGRLAEDRTLHRLPGKFGFLIDDGHWPTLAGIEADVRFDWTGREFSVAIGGTRADARQVGTCEPAEVVDRAAGIAQAFLAAAGAHPKSRRMRDVVGPVADACGSFSSSACEKRRPHPTSPEDEDALSREREEEGAWTIVGQRTFCGSPVLGVAAPFGRLDARMLHEAAAAASHELRLTPWRAILLPDATASHVPGFISDPADRRLAVAACVGASGCANGTTDTHADASALSDVLPADRGIAIHVSGCEKGCAKPSRARFTLVAHDGRYDFVRSGQPTDAPWRRDLDLAEARDLLRALA